MDYVDDQDLRQAELSYCLNKSLDFVDKQALEDVKEGKPVGDGTENEEETPEEWLVDTRYATRLLKKANEMRCRKRLCDVTIGLADGKLEVHKSMLAAGSSFFKHLTETTRANTLNFYHVPCCVADILFDFMYTGEINQEKIAKLSRSEKRVLREKADLFQVSDQLEHLWVQLGLQTGKKENEKTKPQMANADVKSEMQEPSAKDSPVGAQSGGDSNEIVKRKVLYMNERRKQGEFADWKIRISAVDIPVSKVFLAASCTYFADFFVRNPMDAKSETYTLSELNRRTFRKVLNFIYTGHVITEGRELGELKDLLFQATYLGIGDLSNRLVQEMEARLDAENCFQMFSYANTINCRQLFKSISRYIGCLGSDSAKNSGFLSLELADLKAVLLNPELRFDRGPCLLYPTEFERCVFDLLLSWIRVDHVRRSSHVTELFELVERLGSPPHTGRKEAMHGRMPKELNHVMSVYYSKMLMDPTKSQKQNQESRQATRVRRHLLPTRLLVSREYPVACPQREDAALMPTELEPQTDGEEAVEVINRCWQLPPTEWKLQSVRIFATDESLTRITGLEMKYQRYPLFSEDPETGESRTVRCGYLGAFEHSLELLATERIAKLGLCKEVGVGGARTFIGWVRTCIGRRMGPAGEPADNRPEETIGSPEGSRGFLHGFGLRFNGAGGADGGVLTVVWAVEADIHGLGDAPWNSVIESE